MDKQCVVLVHDGINLWTHGPFTKTEADSFYALCLKSGEAVKEAWYLESTKHYERD